MRPIFALSLCAALAAVAATAFPAHAQSTAITGLFNTGISSTGTLLTAGEIDPHYVFINGASTTQTVVTNLQSPTYAFDANSRYIWNNADGSPGSGTYTLRLSFDLSGFDAATAQISGRYSTDNAGVIQLNGNSVGTPSSGFSSYTNFSITTGFVSGINNLDFVVTDQGPPGALAVTDLAGTARLVGTANAPEPSALALLVLPLAGVVTRRRASR